MSSQNPSENNSNVMPTPIMVSSISPTSSAVLTKICHIVKRPDFEGYGFNLHSEKIKPGQYIGKVDSNSPAEAAGLKEGDRIIEVNGMEIRNETHKQVVQRIKAIAYEVRLLLIDVGCGTSPNKAKGNNETASTEELSFETKQEMPDFSYNIQSVSMSSTKRSPTFSNQSDKIFHTKTIESTNVDVVDRKLNDNNMNNNKSTTTTLSETSTAPSNGFVSKNILPPSYNGNNNNAQTININPYSSPNGKKTNSLQLPMTAAEMRAKLLLKKKYDPKNESVDLKKKFDIIQML